jgi:hypothetical protein
MIFEGSDYSDIQATPCQVMDSLRTELPSIVQRCQDLRNKYVSSQFGDVGGESFVTYAAYIGLTKTYQKIIEYFNDKPSRELIIEEVD